MPIKIAITGATGRMGKMLIEAVLASTDMQLTAAFEQENSPFLGQDAGLSLGKTTGVLLSHDINAGMQQSDILIDFTRPEGTLSHLKVCKALNKKIIVGTTGFSDEEKAQIVEAADSIGVVFSANMSIGVNVTLKLLALATQYLHNDYDIEVFEAHHKHKVDAPSGTALAMGEVIAKAKNDTLNNLATWARQGHTGVRENGKIGFSVMRGGDIVGDHTAFFVGEGERIEITHRSNSRVNYAQGSLKAARFLMHTHTPTAGLFTMQDVLGL